jgi:very-short-patch-repair endonuclease
MLDVLSRAELRAQGMTERGIRAAVRGGVLVRARRDCYLGADAPPELVRAVRVGGRLGCVSLLALHGVFVFDHSALHVHMERGDSRMRDADSAAPLPARRARRAVTLHWHRLTQPASAGCVDIVDALIAAVRCQSPRNAIATLDSALHLGLADADRLDEVFGALPRRFRILRSFLDGRAESGTETLVRLMLWKLGCRVDLQVPFRGVGFVDLLVDGWLVVECDSREFHSSWEQQRKDYVRDRRLAAEGYCVLRLSAEDILYRPEVVVEALRGLVHSSRGV